MTKAKKLCIYCDNPRMGHGFTICKNHYTEIFGNPNDGSKGTYPLTPPEKITRVTGKKKVVI